MSVHSAGRGKHRVEWIDVFGANRVRGFRRKLDAEAFGRAVNRLRAECSERGYVTQADAFDINHPEAHWAIVGELDDLLSAIYPEHNFRFSIDDDGTQQMPLSGSISWTGISKADDALEQRDRDRRFRELGDRHPAILDGDGEIDFDKSDQVSAAIAAEPDLFPVNRQDP